MLLSCHFLLGFSPMSISPKFNSFASTPDATADPHNDDLIFNSILTVIMNKWKIFIPAYLIRFINSKTWKLCSFGSELDAIKQELIDYCHHRQDEDRVELCKLSSKQFKLLYRATRDGFRTSSFHAKCYHQPNTLTVIKTTKGYIFGASTSLAWDSSSGWKAGASAFIFSLVNMHSTPHVVPAKADINKTIFSSVVCGPLFGFGNDFFISDNSNTNLFSKSNLG